jgi:hypothetical protein
MTTIIVKADKAGVNWFKKRFFTARISDFSAIVWLASMLCTIWAQVALDLAVLTGMSKLADFSPCRRRFRRYRGPTARQSAR